MNDCRKEVLQALDAHPEGLRLRQIQKLTNWNTRELKHAVDGLRHRGSIEVFHLGRDERNVFRIPPQH